MVPEFRYHTRGGGPRVLFSFYLNGRPPPPIRKTQCNSQQKTQCRKGVQGVQGKECVLFFSDAGCCHSSHPRDAAHGALS